MVMRAILAGVPGVGKTTVIGYLKSGIKVVNFGDVMLEVSGFRSRDAMREEIPPGKYREIQRKAARRIARMENVIVDTHLAVFSGKGFYPGMPPQVASLIKPDIVFLLEKSPHAIRRQSAKDRSRTRNYTVEEIRLHQQMNRMYAVSLSQMAGCYLKIIEIDSKESRPFEGAIKAAKEIDRVISEWL